MTEKKPKKPKPTIQFPDGTVVECDLTKCGTFAVHRPLGSKKDYVVTFLPDYSVALRTRLKGDATSTAKLLSWLRGVLGDDEIESLVRKLQASIEYTT